MSSIFFVVLASMLFIRWVNLFYLIRYISIAPRGWYSVGRSTLNHAPPGLMN